MALIACSECQKEVSDKAATCPHCGAPIQTKAPARPRGTYYDDLPATAAAAPAPAKQGSGLWKWLLGVPVGAIALLMVIGSCAGSTPEGRDRSNKRAAIDLCWQEQSKKSNDPATAQFIAGTCEKMEADARR